MVDVGVESAVVLSYPQLYSADRESFNFLDDLYGKVPVAICCNSSARHEEFYAKYGRTLGLMHSRKEPWAVIAHSADTYMDHMEKASVLPPKNAVASFLQDQTLPIFGELNAETLPRYYKSQADLVMLFGTEPQRRVSGRTLADMALRSKDRSVKYIWVNRQV
ncbi:unnamed protein product, partial [Notodromas monacha]